jgi:hypothetical protein
MKPVAGYSGTPLAKKLGIVENSKVLTVGAPKDYANLLKPIPPGVEFANEASKSIDVVHLFTTEKKELRSLLTRFRKSLRPNAAIWVSWPKKASKVATDITEDNVREVALPMGFVDIKVCAVTDVWSGLKLVVRKELR